MVQQWLETEKARAFFSLFHSIYDNRRGAAFT
jgi:hypothetical protein